MHGIIHAEIKKFVEKKFPEGTWQTLLNEAGLTDKIYQPNSSYPDAEAVAIVSAASKLTGIPADAILEDFGEFLVPDLVSMYRWLIKPEWKTIEMLMHTEESIHRVIRLKDPNLSPPQLRFEQISPNQLQLHYNSPRKMISVAKGIIKGVAKNFNQKVEMSEKKNKDDSIVLTIKVT